MLFFLQVVGDAARAEQATRRKRKEVDRNQKRKDKAQERKDKAQQHDDAAEPEQAEQDDDFPLLFELFDDDCE